MTAFIWIGTTFTLIGIIGLIACIVMAYRLKRSNLPKDAVKASLQRIVVLNLGALAISALGLMSVVFGVIMT